MRIHAIDMVQPPGICIPPIADIELHQATVIAALAPKTSADTPAKARPLALAVFITTAPPDTGVGLVAAERRAIEPGIHAPDRIESARERGIRVVDDAVLERERAHARP